MTSCFESTWHCTKPAFRLPRIAHQWPGQPAALGQYVLESILGL
jgi:hypothetical protein